MSSLKPYLDTLISECSSDDYDSGEQHARGRVAYKITERATEMRARKEDLAQLERELGRPPTKDEIDLIFGEVDVTNPDTPRTMQGDYGRQEVQGDDMDDEAFDTRRAARGPTARRFNERAKNGSSDGLVRERILKEAVDRPRYDTNNDQSFHSIGYGLAAHMVEPAIDYFLDMLEDGEHDITSEGPRGAIMQFVEIYVDSLTEESTPVFGDETSKYTEAMANGASTYIAHHQRAIDAYFEKAEAFYKASKINRGAPR